MTWFDPEMVGEPKPWGRWDYVAAAILLVGFGAIIGACLTMYIQQRIGP